MNWRDRLAETYQTRKSQGVPASPRFRPGASEVGLAEAERTLGQRLPEDLRALLSESDGVMEVLEIGSEQIESLWIVWTTEEIVKGQSNPWRAEIGPPPEWLVFASAGVDGIDFAYDRAEESEQIWAWHPMESRRQLVGESLDGFLRGWIDGSVAV